MKGKSRATAFRLFLATACVYALTNYGGIRSSDAEIVFRVGESMTGGGVAIRELEDWPGFGVAKGPDGRFYGIYPPVQSVIAAPLIGLARLLDRTGWYRPDAFRVPASHYVERGLLDALREKTPEHKSPHALRFIVSFFNSIIGALGVVVFWSVARRFTRGRAATLGLTALYAFGTPLWSYSDTFFTEPLATLLVLVSFRLLIGQDPDVPEADSRTSPWAFAGSGIALGLACGTHPTAILFAPFFLGYAWLAGVRREGARRAALRALLPAIAGLALLLGLLACYNVLRFGNPLQDGRSISQMNTSAFVGPWTAAFRAGAWGLLAGAHKGILIFCPAVLLGLLGWRSFHKRHAALAWILAGAVTVRWLFIASFEGGEGGFCLGPRYLVMGIPFLLLPAGALLDSLFAPGGAWRPRLAAGFILLCVLQQFWFASGEIFSYYHFLKIGVARQHLSLSDQAIYGDWATSPAIHLLEHQKGPFLFRQFPLGAWSCWGVGALILTGAFIFAYRRWRRSTEGS